MEKLYHDMNKNLNPLEKKCPMSKIHMVKLGLLILTSYLTITWINWKKAPKYKKGEKNKLHFIRHKNSDARNKLCVMVVGKLLCNSQNSTVVHQSLQKNIMNAVSVGPYPHNF